MVFMIRILQPFSPLAGIRYAETSGSVAIFVRRAHRFRPLAGIRYSETCPTGSDRNRDFGFSPLAGIRYSET